jgi:hypothetical protein
VVVEASHFPHITVDALALDGAVYTRFPLGLRTIELTLGPLGKWHAIACALPLGNSGHRFSTSEPCLKTISILMLNERPYLVR